MRVIQVWFDITHYILRILIINIFNVTSRKKLNRTIHIDESQNSRGSASNIKRETYQSFTQIKTPC